MKTSLLIVLASLTLAACSTFTPKDMEYRTLSPKGTDISLEYGVYTPPGWTREEALPLVLFLHGGGDTHTSFEKFKAHEYLDQQILSGKLPRFILVTPNGRRGFWENWHDGSYRYRSWILEELLPQVQANYNTRACPEHCHLAGISMGGFGVLRFAYFSGNNFSSVSAISAPIIGQKEYRKSQKAFFLKLFFPLEKIFGPYDEEKQLKEQIETVWVDPTNQNLQSIRLQLVWGDDDHKQILESNKRFHQVLSDKHRPHETWVYSGGHKWKYWVPNLQVVFEFLLGKETLVAK